MPFAKYPEIDNVYKVQNIFLEQCIVTEKVHGSNFRFGISDNTFYVGGRNQVFLKLEKSELDVASAINDQFGFVNWVLTNNLHKKCFELFDGQDITFHGEWLGKGIQKGITYCEDKQFWCFDVRINGELISWNQEGQYHAKQLNLNLIPIFHTGIITLELLNDLLKIPSRVSQFNGILEPQLIEGVVIKPIVPKRDVHGEWLMCKFKNEKFAERTSEAKDKNRIVMPETALEFVKEFTTRNRLDHVLDKLKEANVDISNTSATGNVLKGMHEDILKEGAEELKLVLSESIDWKAISKLISNKTRELFMDYLKENLVKSINKVPS